MIKNQIKNDFAPEECYFSGVFIFGNDYIEYSVIIRNILKQSSLKPFGSDVLCLYLSLELWLLL